MLKKICVIGLGYVGLPLAIEFGKKRNIIGFDTNKVRVDELQNHYDSNLESTTQDFKDAVYLNFSSSLDEAKDCCIFIITVPTPVDSHKKPDLTALKESSKAVGAILKKGDIVIYESTVFPGATEEICAPILEEQSNLKFNQGFFCGYSPERVNPGDKEHRLSDIKKVTSGSTKQIADQVDELYQEIIRAGTHKADSIRVAEAAKVIENTQRDLNIALINEFSIIFNKLGVDTESVLEAASTKWNFLPFMPGLVGGHCIGVDPYYLTHKSLEVGYEPEVILAGRRINDNMGQYIVNQVEKLMSLKGIQVKGSNILIMGLTFKENCPDTRNTRVIDLVEGFQELNSKVDIYDPWVDKEKTLNGFDIKPISQPKIGNYDAIILAVAHDEFKALSLENITLFGKEKHVLYDVKYLLKANEVDGRL